MAFVNYLTSDVAVKIVYYGPGLSGKTTNLRHIYQKLDSSARGELVCLESDTSRTYFFDLLLIKAGLIGDFKLHFHLMGCPGQVFYEASRKSVLAGADGLVFVADSQMPLLDANLESFDSLRRNLEELRMDLNAIPLVFQFNKRDLDDLIPVETFNNLLNPLHRPYYEASAINGQGVFETFRGIASLAIPVVRAQILPDQAEEIEETPEETEKKIEQAIVETQEEAPTQASSSSSKEEIRHDINVRKIRLRSEKDIEKELELLSREFSKKR